MADCAKFQSALLENNELLTEKSDGASVTGSSSAIPGPYLEDDEGASSVDSCNDDSDDADDGTTHDVGGAKVADEKPNAPNASAKRMGASISHSSKKCREDPIVRAFRCLVDFPISTKVEPVGESFVEIMDLVVQSGAEEGNGEHRIATKLFIKLEYRYVFLTLKTNKGRLGWLKRMWEQERKNVVSITEIMDLVVQCGAKECSDEHFVATTLVSKPEYREMFLALNTNQERFAWLKRMWEEKKKH